jgi:hypothetical protein
MRGRTDEAVNSLDVALTLVSGNPRDAVAIGLLKSELLRLQFQYNEALQVMNDIITPRLAALNVAERFGVEQNLADSQFYSHRHAGDGTNLFYNNVDRMHLLRIEWLDYRELFSAEQSAKTGKHFKTLAILWQQHRRAYLSGCWMVQRWTNQLMAAECVHLSKWADAVHHAIVATDDGPISAIADGILSTKSVGLVEVVVRQIIATSNLRGHFVLACKILQLLHDAIPDDLVPIVGQWILLRAQEDREHNMGPNHVSAAWSTISALGSRYPSDLVRSTIDVGIQHKAWTTQLDNPNRVIPERQHIVQAITQLAIQLSVDEFERLAQVTLPLITERRQVSDYRDVVELLCRLAERGGHTVQEYLGDRLYPPGREVDRTLALVAEVFGKERILDSARIKEFAKDVAREILRQVQRLSPDEVAEPVAEQIMEYCDSERSLRVSLVSLTGLHTLARHRTQLDDESVSALVSAILEMSQDKDNFCSNRESLLRVLSEFADSISLSVRAATIAVLESIADGNITESAAYPKAAEAEDQLNPFQMRHGKPEDVQSAGLKALAKMTLPGTAAMKRFIRRLEEAICDHRSEIRRAGYVASGRVEKVTEGIMLGILTGLRDPDPHAAATAFAVLASNPSWRLIRSHWRVFLMAIRIAQRTGLPMVRRHAAAALTAWVRKCPNEMLQECRSLLLGFRADICYSVRSKANDWSKNQEMT